MIYLEGVFKGFSVSVIYGTVLTFCYFLFASGPDGIDSTTVFFLYAALFLTTFIGHVYGKQDKKKRLDDMAGLVVAAGGWREKRKDFRSIRKSDDDWRKLFEEGETILAKMSNVRLPSNVDNPFWSNHVRTFQDDLKDLELARITGLSSSSVPQGQSISDLARLRKDGLITVDEFDAFTEVFKKSTGEAAREVIGAIEQLHEQYRAGAMGQGNYHASLWTLMDRLERDMRG